MGSDLTPFKSNSAIIIVVILGGIHYRDLDNCKHLQHTISIE